MGAKLLVNLCKCSILYCTLTVQYSNALSLKSKEIFVYKLLISATPRTVTILKSISVLSTKSKVSFRMCKISFRHSINIQCA